MALGWDTAWAAAAIYAGVPFIAAVPFAGQESRWPAQSQARYHALLAKAAEVVIVCPGGYSARAMHIRNEWMVDRCDEVVALRDGSASGTGNCVRYARGVGKPVVNLWIEWARSALCKKSATEYSIPLLPPLRYPLQENQTLTLGGNMARRRVTDDETNAEESPCKRRSKSRPYTPPFHPPALLPRTANQERLLRYLRTSEQVITVGPPGTGKTYLPACFAADLLQKGSISQIILTRPVVPISATQRLGFRPGNMNEKMAEWMAELFKDLRLRMGSGAFDTAVKSGKIAVVPFETMRGRTFDDAFVILDEAQNCTYHELKMFLTRIGEGSRVVINGDMNQSDLKEESGLSVILDIAQRYGLDVPVVEFGLEDIVRGDICAMWIKACYQHERGAT